MKRSRIKVILSLFLVVVTMCGTCVNAYAKDNTKTAVTTKSSTTKKSTKKKTATTTKSSTKKKSTKKKTVVTTKKTPATTQAPTTNYNPSTIPPQATTKKTNPPTTVADVDIPVTTDSVLSINSSNLGIVTSLCSTANNGAYGLTIMSVDSKNKLLKFNNEYYNTLDSEKKRVFMENALSSISKSSLSAKSKNSIYNFIANQDTATTNAMKYLQQDANADFVSAKKFFSPFNGVIGTVLGVICVAVFLLAGLSMAVDIFYIALPGFQGILNRDDVDKPPIGVSREAWTAIRDSESSDKYKSPLSIYLKRRVLIIFLMSICLLYLVSGKIYDLVIFFMDAFSNV